MAALGRSFLLSPWARLLAPAGWIYGRAAAARRRSLSRRAARLEVPVISVGNITCGGTGKTPVVEMLASMLLARGRKPAVLIRGYRAADGQGDEARLLAANLPGVGLHVGRNRVDGGRAAISAGADVLLLDDGFQHAGLARDLDLVLIDALDPFGGGRVLPAGLLREPLEALAGASLFGITRGALVPPEARAILRGILRERFPGIPCFGIETEPLGWESVESVRRAGGGGGRGTVLPGGPPVGPAGGRLDVAALGGKRVAAFAGIGNPDAFRLSLPALGVEVAAWLPFPDHHRYRQADVDEIRRRSEAAGAEAVVTTQKDAVNLPKVVEGPEASEGPEGAGGSPPWLFLRIACRPGEGAGELEQALARALSAVPAAERGPAAAPESGEAAA